MIEIILREDTTHPAIPRASECALIHNLRRDGRITGMDIVLDDIHSIFVRKGGVGAFPSRDTCFSVVSQELNVHSQSAERALAQNLLKFLPRINPERARLSC